MDAMGFLVLVELRDFTFTHHHPTHAGSHDHADAVRILFRYLKAGIGQRFLCRHKGKLGVPIDPIAMGVVEKSFDREVAHLACDLRAIAIHGKGVERRNRRDPGLASEGSLPKLTDPDPDRRHDT
ncbi:MAG: hypothetical protein K8R65_01910 [Nitrospirae bacterium]|nr:hypothetical protein [Nitrospirota bacterium]